MRPERLNDRTVALIVQCAVARAGLNPSLFAAHMRRTRHKSVDVARGYVRVADVWRDNVNGAGSVSRGAGQGRSRPASLQCCERHRPSKPAARARSLNSSVIAPRTSRCLRPLAASLNIADDAGAHAARPNALPYANGDHNKACEKHPARREADRQRRHHT